MRGVIVVSIFDSNLYEYDRGRRALLAFCPGLRLACVCFLLFFLGGSDAVHAQQPYPNRLVRIIVPNTTGGPVDLTARLLADRLSQMWGQPVIIDNRPGAGGNIGTAIVAKADPDGYVLLLTPNAPLIANPSLYSNLPFDPEADFAPITVVYTSPLVLTVSPTIPANSVAELVKYIKDRPGQLNFASGGIGTPPHLAAELLKVAAGLDVVHVPYRGGAEMTLATTKGDVAFSFNGLLVMPLVQGGQMKAIAVASPKRSALAPDLPSMSESGYPDFDVASWGFFLAPAKTPPANIRKLHDDTVKALNEPGIRTKMIAAGIEPVGNESEELKAQIKTDGAYWSKVIKTAHIHIN
jgi:tripartite-type tricarboxylate transporter receptor subunit TctC